MVEFQPLWKIWKSLVNGFRMTSHMWNGTYKIHSMVWNHQADRGLDSFPMESHWNPIGSLLKKTVETPHFGAAPARLSALEDLASGPPQGAKGITDHFEWESMGSHHLYSIYINCNMMYKCVYKCVYIYIYICMYKCVCIYIYIS